MTQEESRLQEARKGTSNWKKWGPYLSERQWGTVREDYSEGGDAWNFFTHDQARSRAYRWGEDGIAGISDDKQRLCFALALWNGKVYIRGFRQLVISSVGERNKHSLLRRLNPIGINLFAANDLSLRFFPVRPFYE